MTYQIDIAALGAFSDSVHLTLNNLPAGVVSDLPDSVDATATINLTLSNLSSLAAGHYVMPFTASNADGSVSQTETLYLVIKEGGRNARDIRRLVRFYSGSSAKNVMRRNGVIPYSDNLALASRALDRARTIQQIRNNNRANQ